MSKNPELNNVTPLSQANLNRKSHVNISGITENQLREILSSVIDERVTAQLTRLENSMNRMANQFESIRNGDSKDAALRVTTDLENADIALGSINLPKEEYYPYTCTTLADALEIRVYDVTQKIKELNLRNDIKYHMCISTGRTGKTHKYSEAALQKLKES
ncbi:MAG: hypothetical protein ACFCU5_02510 [Pleurocapsa sp.]